MTTQKKQDVTTLPGLWQTIAAGFDLTTKHLWLLLLPVFLDSFFWLGPRLSIFSLMQKSLAGSLPLPGFAATNEQMLDLVAHFNVFTLLSVPMVGVPALMTGLTSDTAPVTPFVWEIDGYGLWFLLFVGLTVGGLLLTAVYFGLVAQAIRAERLATGQFLRQMGKNWLQLLALTGVMMLTFCIVYTPLLPIGTVLFLFNPALGSLSFSCGSVLLLWLVIYLAFIPHGITLNGRSLRHAFIESLRLVQLNFVPAITMLFGVFIINRALNFILRLADNGNWLTFISIIGHAFVTTSLVVATFIFYRDRINLVIDKLNTNYTLHKMENEK
jgi:hypothetical protein